MNKFPKSMRLLKGHEFRYVKKTSKQVIGRYIILSFTETIDDLLRVGMITSKRYDTKAVARNRARRLMRESFRELSSQINQPVWLVFIARNFLHNKSQSNVKQEMAELLYQANLC